MDHFKSSYLKIRRANRHVAEIHLLFASFGRSNFYNLTIQKDPETGSNFLCFEIDLFNFPFDVVAAAIGDAVHNLRSCLDHLYYQAVLRCGGTPTQWTRFPISESKEKLIAVLNGALKRKQIHKAVADLIINKIRPFPTGNENVWGIHSLNVRDKHEVLTPVIKLTGIYNVALEDENHARIGNREYFIARSTRIKLTDADNRTVTVKNKGRSFVFAIFDEEPFKSQVVVPKLKKLPEEVAGIIEAFESPKLKP